MLAIQRFDATGAIDAAFRVYRQHFKPLFLVSLVAGLPTVLMDLFTQTMLFRMQDSMADGAEAGFETLFPMLVSAGLVWMLGLVALLVASVFGIAATTHLASCAALNKPLHLGQALQVAWQRFGSLLGASSLMGLAFLIGFLLFLVPGVVLMCGLAFVPAVIVLEHVGATDAMSRSWQLTQGKRWKILGVWLIYLLILMSALGGIAVVTHLSSYLSETLPGTLLAALINQAVAVLATPVGYIATVLLYYDARVTHEAFDVQMLAQSVEPAP